MIIAFNVFCLLLAVYNIMLIVMYNKALKYYSKANEYYTKISSYYYSTYNVRADGFKNKGDYWFNIANKLCIYDKVSEFYKRLGDKA